MQRLRTVHTNDAIAAVEQSIEENPTVSTRRNCGIPVRKDLGLRAIRAKNYA